MKPSFFPTPAHFRKWFEQHHDTEPELLVGFYKKGTGKPSIDWPQSVDEALCFGWIDGVRRSIDEESYSIRFTPRRKGSIWSAVNVRKVAQLTQEGRMHATGLAAYEAREENKTAIYSYENRADAKLDEAGEQQFKANDAAWMYFQARPSWYRTAAIHWVANAKREETRTRRLEQLISDSAQERTVGPLTRPGTKATG